MQIFNNISGLPVGNDGVEEEEFGCAVVGVVLGLDLVEDDGVKGECPVDVRGLKESEEDGFD